MAAKIIKRIVSLDGPIPVDVLPGALYTGENGGHEFWIYGRRGAQALALSGAVTAQFVNENEETVPLTGSILDGAARVALPAECYHVPGKYRLTVFCALNGESSAVYRAEGRVASASTTTAYDPAGRLPDTAELAARIEAAVASIPADYSALLAAIAPTFSSDAAYTSGDYVWYSGALYRFYLNHAPGEWNAAQATAVAAMDEITAICARVPGYFIQGQQYRAGDLVWRNGELYRCTQPQAWLWDGGKNFEGASLGEGVPRTIGGNAALALYGAEKSANRFVSYDVGDGLKAHVGETITVSFELMASVARPIRVYPYQNAEWSIADTAYFTPGTSDYTRFSFVTTARNYGAVEGVTHNGRVGFYDEAGDNTISVRNFKIELGHTATPWAMSAQDAVISAQGIAEEASAAVAPVEAGGASAHNYAIGDWLIWKNALYKATATIATGDALAVGTNLAAASVSAEVATVKTDLARASAGLLTPEQALTKRTYIQNGSFSYSSRTVEIQDGVITYTGRASGGTDWITIFISGSFSTSTKGIDIVVPSAGACLPIALLDGVTHLQLYRETDAPGALWFAVFFCGVDENENVTVLHVVRPAMAIAEGAGPIKAVPLSIPAGATHFAIGFYSTKIADLRNTTTKVIPLFRTFPANE